MAPVQPPKGSRRLWVTEPSRSWRIFASIGYVITSRPRAIGTVIPSTGTAGERGVQAGNPATMAAAIHTGGNFSRVDRRVDRGHAVTASPVVVSTADSRASTSGCTR